MPPWHTYVQTEYSRGALKAPHRVRHHWLMTKRNHFIRQWRKFRGLSQIEFAEQVGVTQGQVSKIESGKRDYDQSFLERAAEVLRCSDLDLLARDPQAPMDIMDIYNALLPNQQVQLVEIAKTIKRTGTLE